MSLRLRGLNLALRLFAKPRLTRLRALDVVRRDVERVGGGILRRPPFLCALQLDLGAGLAALSVRAGQVKRPGAVGLYLHGGAYIAGSPRAYLPLLGRLAGLARVEIVAPDYRLAPEHPFPAALQDAEAAWNALLARGYAPENIVLIGDSAGGGLALALLARLCARATPPAGLVAFSPWTDLTGAGASIWENRNSDSMLVAARLPETAQMYLQGAAADDPGASPLFARFPDCPPVLIQLSDSEILRDDGLRMADRLRAFGARVTVQTWVGAPHVWHMFDGYVPEARAALQDAARAMRAMLRLSSASGDS
jgi:acetyl esterase/lipase